VATLIVFGYLFAPCLFYIWLSVPVQVTNWTHSSTKCVDWFVKLCSLTRIQTQDLFLTPETVQNAKYSASTVMHHQDGMSSISGSTGSVVWSINPLYLVWLHVVRRAVEVVFFVKPRFLKFF